MSVYAKRWTGLGLVVGLIAALASRVNVWQDLLVIAASTAIGLAVGQLVTIVRQPPPWREHVEQSNHFDVIEEDS